MVAPRRGRLSWEPGGQLEYASPPCASPLKAAGLAAEVVRRVASAAAEDGVRLLARGMDPATRVQDTRLLLDRPRYRRMTAHYRRRGPEGERMMRLTAGIHLNVDLGPDPMARFRAANRLVPLLGAIFANSPRRQDADEAWRSHRSEQWRRLDPSRSGVVDGEDPEACYAEFAAGADAFLLGADDRPAIPFAEHLDSASPSELAEHLTTLFPEVRPRGYLEIRVVDALPADLYPVVTAFTVGLLFDRDSTQALMRGPGASADRLERAGREGVRDPELRAEALEALGRAARTWERQGTPVGERAARDLRRFAEGFTARGLDPGDAAATCVDDPIVTPSGAPSAA